MNIMAAMEDTMVEAEACWKRYLQEGMRGYVNANVNANMRLEHLRHMAMDMRRRDMSGTKKCRYLGWMQASIVSWDAGANLDTMKNINKAHRDDVPTLSVDGDVITAVMTDEYHHNALYVYDATSQTFDAVTPVVDKDLSDLVNFFLDTGESAEFLRRYAALPRQSVVVCLNDFPDGVFDSQELADAYIAEQKALYMNNARIFLGHRRRWHTHIFTQNKGRHS